VEELLDVIKTAAAALIVIADESGSDNVASLVVNDTLHKTKGVFQLALLAEAIRAADAVPVPSVGTEEAEATRLKIVALERYFTRDHTRATRTPVSLKDLKSAIVSLLSKKSMRPADIAVATGASRAQVQVVLEGEEFAQTGKRGWYAMRGAQ
jgi:hypothetical protein